MKRILTLLLLINTSLFAQQGQWTWMNGNNIPDQPAVYGTQGVFAAANTPKGMYEPCQWTDQQGNFWLFGGVCPGVYYESALWKFDPLLNEWEWVKGPNISNQNGVYGTVTVPNIANNPGARAYGVMTWTDANNNLWMFGGFGYDGAGNLGRLSDLWKYNITTNTWTWMKGPNIYNTVATYGTINVQNAANNPGARSESSATWVDASNNLWLFGGSGFDGTNTIGDLGDLWKYNPVANAWTWMKGPNTINQPSVYGTLTVPNAANYPSGRFVFSAWKDDAGDFWIFGGLEFQSGANHKNDLWRYRIATNDWTWMSGTNLNNDVGSTGQRCSSSSNYVPASRYESRATWKRGCNNFEVFGGGNNSQSINYNDLWDYCVSTNKWTWMSGSLFANQPNIYGTETISNAANVPSGRTGSVSWKDVNGNLWMFGGQGVGVFLNDMWRFVPDTLCPIIGGAGLVHSAFTNQPDTGCAPMFVSFTNTSVNGVTYLWRFGDNTTSTSTNPTHTFTDTGTFTVKLIAYSGCGGLPDSVTHTVRVVPRPNASFFADTLIGCNILTVTFTNQSTNGVSYYWYFGDGNHSTSASPTHSYGPGVYNVILQVTGANGCVDDTTIAHYITVIAQPTVAPSFIPNPSTGCFPMTVHFTNTSNVGTSWYWEFGDGFTDTAQNPTHTYDTVGHFLVYLTVTDSTICGIQTAIYTRWDTVLATPVNHFTATPMSGCTPDTVVFNNTTTGSVSWLWNFGDLTTSASASPTHIYNTAGHDTVTLISYGGGGCNDTTHLVITVNQTQTVASTFTASPLSGCVPLTVSFNNTSTNATSTLWTFGDTFTSTTVSPSHTYTAPGTYIAKLYSANTSVCGTVVDSSTVTIVVYPYAHDTFTVSPSSGCTPLTVTFTNLSTNATNYHWDFGDAGTSTSVSPTHTYTTAGTDTVTMIAYGQGGCNDTMRYYPVTVIGAPTTVCAFTPVNNLQACDSLTVQFTNGSTNAMAYLWGFGDGGTSTLTNPSHTYTASGTYNVTLIAYDTTACGVASDTSRHLNQITINTSAHAAFPDSSFVGCNNLTINWGNSSTNGIGYLWSFGDGNTSTSGNPQYTYSTPGVYEVSLIAYGAGGCNDTLINQDTVTIINTNILSAFIADSVSGCSPFLVHFTNHSVNGLTYLWNFGDGGTSTSFSPSHTYLDSGTFTVRLYTYHNTNSPCGILIDSSVLIPNITVDTPIHPQSIFMVEPMTGCSPMLVTFADSSLHYNFKYWNFGDGSFDSLATYLNPTRIYHTGNYTVTLITYYLNKCNTNPDTMKANISVDTCNLIVSNVFSPNSDGKNDYFKFEADGFTEYHLKIFDRWGLKVFESTDTKLQWNGKVNNTGGDCPDGTYYYIFTSIDFNQQPFLQHGFISLIR